MAIRPIFLPQHEAPFWKEVDIEFEWHPGMAASQKQKSVESLHDAALDTLEISRPLEVSSKSTTPLGVNLSAFRLAIVHKSLGEISLESAFQGSKIFSESGQITDAYELDSRDAKALAKDTNETETLLGFNWTGRDWPLEPKSWFYDWLYIAGVLHTLPDAPAQLRRYDSFTDIEFNPKKSFNCQARSCAIIAASESDQQLRKWIEDPELLVPADFTQKPVQPSLF